MEEYYMADILYTVVKKPTRKHGLQKSDTDAITAEILKSGGFNDHFCHTVMMQSEELLHRADLAHMDVLIFGHDDDMVDFPIGRGSIHITSLISKMEHSFRPINLSELENSIVVKSTVVYFPINLMLTDEHLAHMDSPMQSKWDMVWPYRWELEGEPGTYSYVCVVHRIDEHIYEFRVIMLTDKPTDLAGWFDIYTSLKQIGATTVSETTNVTNQADILIATAAQNFFKEQLAVRPYVMIYFRTALNDPSPPKRAKKPLKTKTNLEECYFPSTCVFERIPEGIKPKYYRNCYQSMEEAMYKPRDLLLNTRYAHYLTGIFGYNPNLLSDDPDHVNEQNTGLISGLCDMMPELHLSKEELLDLVYNLCHVRNCAPGSSCSEVRVNG